MAESSALPTLYAVHTNRGGGAIYVAANSYDEAIKKMFDYDMDRGYRPKMQRSLDDPTRIYPEDEIIKVVRLGLLIP